MINRVVGAVGALVYAVGFVLVSSAPGGGEVEASDFEQFYVVEDNNVQIIAGVFLLTLGALALLWFFHYLRSAITTADAGLGWVSTAVGLALVVAGAGILAGPSGTQAFSDTEFVGQPVAHALAQSGYAVMLVGGSLFLALGIGALAISGMRTGVITSWVAIAGVAAALLQLVSFIWIPHFAVPLWVLLASAIGVRAMRASGRRSSAEAAV